MGLCRAQHNRTQLRDRYDRIGGWWHGGNEVDVVAVADADPLLLGECKWSKRAVGIDVLDALKAKTPAVLADLPRQPREVQYALWSRSGFTPELTRRARSQGVLLFDPAAIVGAGADG